MNIKVKKLIGTKEFYKGVLAISLPIMLQNGISNFVNLLDNIMVGRLGTEQLSGVSIVNDLMFVFMLCLFGAISGAGIFTAQYYGQGNMKGVRDTFRIKVIICGLILIASTIVFLLFGNQLISFYLHDGSENGDLALTLKNGSLYLNIMLLGMLPWAIENAISSTLRECGETVVPMRASIVAVFTNMVLNYILIYGKLGLPEMGVAGAAIATVISRFVQITIILIWVFRHPEKTPYFEGALRSLRVSANLMKKVIIMGTPLLLNEALWAAGVVVQKAAYSERGLAVVAGMNINSTIANLFNIVFIALGDAVAILVGQKLGAGDFDGAKDTARKIIAFSTATCVVIGSLLALTSGLFPQIYNTSDEAKQLAQQFILISAVMQPINGLLHSSYFTIRSGGKTGITFLFDSCFLWVLMVPCAFILVRFTTLSIATIFFACESLNLIKVMIGFGILKSGIWMNNIVEN